MNIMVYIYNVPKHDLLCKIFQGETSRSIGLHCLVNSVSLYFSSRDQSPTH
jgi:hypothetical protein